VDVIVYRAGECGSWREAVATVKQAAHELKVTTKIKIVKVRDMDEACTVTELQPTRNVL